MFDRRPDGNELGQLATPFVAADLESNADDAGGLELIRFLLHPRHRQLARVIHRLRQHVELLVCPPSPQLKADVVDRAAEDKAKRLEARLLDEQELVDREVAGEEASGLPHAPQTLAAVLWNRFDRRWVVAHVLPIPSA
jgi:hypothetical protein